MISIIVPVYNAESYISATIDTVAGQSYRDWELLLVDDCSSDRSREIIEKKIAEFERSRGTAADVGSLSYESIDSKQDDICPQPRIRLISKTHNEGAAAARNTGIDEARGRYIAFLDADDIWYSDKLETELKYMQKNDAAFVFTAYQFGDENAQPTGKAVRVPKKLTYKEALSRTIIFTSTVMMDTEKISRELMHMPAIASEDTATWWRILKSGVVAYGLNQTLAIYRRPAKSLSSNKANSVGRIWNLYRQIAGMNAVAAALHIIMWAFRAAARRVVDDTIRSHFESVKRFSTLQLSFIGIIIQTLLFAYTWFKTYYPIINSMRISQDGYVLGYGIKLYFRGHLLFLAFYLVLMIFFASQAGAMKIGLNRPVSVFLSSTIAIGITDIIIYAQMSLMRNWLVPAWPLVRTYVAQIGFAYIWIEFADFIYHRVFPPRETLVISGATHDFRSGSIIDQLGARQDRFKVAKQMSTAEGMDRVLAECLSWYGCVVIGDVTSKERKMILEFCYGHYIRVYDLPEVRDILINGAEVMDQFQTPLLEFKEYNIRWEQRLVKRLCDIVISAVLIIVTSPIMLFRLIDAAVHPSPEGIIERTVCVTKNGKTFVRHTFRSQGTGHTLPMLFDVFRGRISMVGPEPLPAELESSIVECNPKFVYRRRVETGYTGKSQRSNLVFTKNDGSTDLDLADDILLVDMMYIQNYSLLEDFRILLTVPINKRTAKKRTVKKRTE